MSIIKKWKKNEIKDWVSDLDKSKLTLYEVMFNIMMLSVIELFIGLFFVDEYFRYVLGLLIGVILAIFLIKNMYSSVNKAVMEDVNTAESITRKGALFRMAVVFVIFVVATYLHKYINVYAMIISTFNLKFAAYLQPLTNKFISTRYEIKGR